MCSWDLVSSVCLPPEMGKSATNACKPGLVCFTSVSQIQMKQFKVSCSGLTCESFGPVQRESVFLHPREYGVWGFGHVSPHPFPAGHRHSCDVKHLLCGGSRWPHQQPARQQECGPGLNSHPPGSGNILLIGNCRSVVYCIVRSL